jgi:hypothetical protein
MGQRTWPSTCRAREASDRAPFK